MNSPSDIDEMNFGDEIADDEEDDDDDTASNESDGLPKVVKRSDRPFITF